MSSATVIGQIVQVLNALPTNVLTSIGKVVSLILAGDKVGAAAEAEKAASLQAGKAAFSAAAKTGRKMRGR